MNSRIGCHREDRENLKPANISTHTVIMYYAKQLFQRNIKTKALTAKRVSFDVIGNRLQRIIMNPYYLIKHGTD
jgi:hypothetical protein